MGCLKLTYESEFCLSLAGDHKQTLGRRKKRAGTYKYKFQNKELQDELGLNWYDFGGRIYMPDIVRTPQLDPLAEKFYDLSPQSFLNNNPLRFTDPTGMASDDIIIISGKQNLKYENGNLYNKDGSAYAGKVDKFTQKTVDALGTISKSKEGAAMVNELQSSKNTFTIAKGNSEFNQSDTNKAYSNQMSTDPAYAGSFATLTKMGVDFSGGSGGAVTWDTSGGLLPTVNGMQTNATTDLAHEMFHALDSNRGMLDDRKEGGVKRNEWQAVFRENRLRSELGKPLRNFYQSTVDENGVKSGTAPSMLSPSNTNVKPSWYKL